MRPHERRERDRRAVPALDDSCERYRDGVTPTGLALIADARPNTPLEIGVRRIVRDVLSGVAGGGWMPTSQVPDSDDLPFDVLVLLGLGGEGDRADVPFDIADDFRLHVISGLSALRGTYSGRRRVLELLRTLSRSADGGLEIEVRHLFPLEAGPDDELLVAVIRMTVGGEAQRSWDLCSVSRQEDGRIRETWVISTSVANPGIAEILRVSGSLSKPFSVECSTCGETADVSSADLGRVLVPPWFWLPLRRSHPLWARCPSCSRRAWLSLGVPALGTAVNSLLARAPMGGSGQ
jgi:hypothetical protein